MRLESKMKPGYEASREYFIVRCGFLRGIVTGLGGRRATIEVEIDGDCAIYDIRIPTKNHWWRRLTQFLRPSHIDEQELHNAYEVMQSMREETQERLDELQRAVDSHHRTESLFIKVFAAAPVAMLITENKEGRIRYVNNRFAEQLGVSRAEALGKTASELAVWASQAERKLVRTERESGTGELGSLEVLLKSRSGELRVILLSTESLIMSGDTSARSGTPWTSRIETQCEKRPCAPVSRKPSEPAKSFATFFASPGLAVPSGPGSISARS